MSVDTLSRSLAVDRALTIPPVTNPIAPNAILWPKPCCILFLSWSSWPVVPWISFVAKRAAVDNEENPPLLPCFEALFKLLMLCSVDLMLVVVCSASL